MFDSPLSCMLSLSTELIIIYSKGTSFVICMMIQVATACALAAHKLRRPVRTYVDRKTDMVMAGGRHPMKITYSVGFKSDGKITALEIEILINAGMSVDVSPIIPSNMLGTLKKYDWGALSFDIKLCKTNHTSKSAMRAPGEVQGSYIAEAIIEHVASFLSMEVDAVRYRNLHTYESLSFFYEDSAGEAPEYTLPSIWDKLAASSSFIRRTQEVKEFNRCNRWCKRGISRVPILHEVMLRATPGRVSILSDGTVCVAVGGIELGQGLWTKVKQMAAFALSALNCNGTEHLLDKVRVIQADTLSMIQGGLTAGSTTSEASCAAVRLCCNILVDRLSPLKESLQKQMGSVTWETLIAQVSIQVFLFIYLTTITRFEQIVLPTFGGTNLNHSTFFQYPVTSTHFLDLLLCNILIGLYFITRIVFTKLFFFKSSKSLHV